MGDLRRGGRGHSKEEPGGNLFGHYAVAGVFRRTVFGGRPPRIIHGGAAIAGAVGRFQANRAVAKPAVTHGRKENGSEGRSSAPAIGAADMAAVPRIQHRGRKLADTRHRSGAASMIVHRVST